MSGKVTQDDFDYVYLRVVFQALVGVLTIQGVDSSVEIGPLVSQIQKIRVADPASVTPPEIDSIALYLANSFRQTLSPDYYLSQLEDFLGQQRFARQLKGLRPRDWREAGETLVSSAFGSKIGMPEPYNPLSTFTITPDAEPIPTGIYSIDSKMPGGGLCRKEYGILCAYTGVGKTTLSLNFAWGAAKSRNKACFATLELDKHKITERLYSLIARHDYEEIRFGRPPHVTKEQVWQQEVIPKVMQNSAGFSQYLQLWDFSDEICTVSALEEWIKREIEREPHNPPKMLVIDWLLCMDEDVKKVDFNQISGKEVRHKLQRYSQDISKRIAQKYQIAVWATHQADAKAEGEDIVTTKHSAEGKSASWKTSTFLGVGTSPEQKAAGIFTVTASKTRDGRNFVTKIRGVLSEQRFESIDDEGADPDPSAVRSTGIQNAIRAGNTTVRDISPLASVPQVIHNVESPTNSIPESSGNNISEYRPYDIPLISSE